MGIQKTLDSDPLIWKPVKGYEEYYKVSNHGDVVSLARDVPCRNGHTRRLKERVLVPHLATNGYFLVGLQVDGVRERALLHRILAFAFIDNPENKPCVNHIDGDKTNNSLDNLEWCTYSENQEHSMSTGLSRNQGETHYNNKLSDADVVKLREMHKKGVVQKDIAEHFNVCRATVSYLVNNKRRVAAGGL